MDTPSPASPQRALVPWIIWGSVTFSLFLYPQFLGEGLKPPNLQAPLVLDVMALVGLGLLAAASIVRFALIRRVESLGRFLPLFIVGIGLAEAPVFVSLFLIQDPATALAVYWLSVLVMVLQAPIRAHRLT